MAFTRADGWLLGAIGGGRQRWIGLQDLIGNADWLNTSIPTFDEVSYGIRRLLDARYVETRGTGASIAFRSTGAGQRIVEEAHTGVDSRGSFLERIATAMGAEPYPKVEREDRSLGRLEGLDSASFDRSIDGWHNSFRDAAKRLVGVDIDKAL